LEYEQTQTQHYAQQKLMFSLSTTRSQRYPEITQDPSELQVYTFSIQNNRHFNFSRYSYTTIRFESSVGDIEKVPHRSVDLYLKAAPKAWAYSNLVPEISLVPELALWLGYKKNNLGA
jgi:hypothetical protein